MNEPLKHPILLVHGLGGFDELRLDFLKGLAPRIEYFRGVAKQLRKLGVPQVYTAAVPSTASIEKRGQALGIFIRKNIAEPRFHIIAHSMGGLDSRHYISRLGGGERVVSLTTLGTPHRGSAIADLTANHLINPLIEQMKKLGLTNWRGHVDTYFAGHRDLTVERLARFNEETPDADGVAYFSHAGNPPAGAVHWILRPFYEMLLRRVENGGPNDGLVTVQSAQWSGWRGEQPADHLSLVNWQFFPPAWKNFNALDFYSGLLHDFANAEGSGDLTDKD